MVTGIFPGEKVTENKQPEIAFQPDSSIELNGRVVTLLFHRPVSEGKVTMVTLKSRLVVREEITDSLGYFDILQYVF